MKPIVYILFVGLFISANSCSRQVVDSTTKSPPPAKMPEDDASALILKMIERERELPALGTEVDGLTWSCEISNLKEKSATATLTVFSGKSSQNVYELFCVFEGTWKIAREVPGISID